MKRCWLLTIALATVFCPSSFAASPTISSLTPNTGAVGSAIVIAGTNFGTNKSKAKVTFNGTSAIIGSFSSTSITATVPSGSTTGNVVVTVSGVASNGVSFTVTPAPSISSLTPNTGAVGSSIVIAGSNFGPSQGNGDVTFGSSSATISNWSASSITAVVPSGLANGNVSVVVTAAGGVASSGVTFTVTAAPNISSLSTNSGSVGSSVTISGTNFGSSQGNGSVTFNGTAATATSWGTGQIQITVPTGATTGNVVVTAAGGVASNGVAFTVAPYITSLSQSSGEPGASITISGSNFTSTTGTVTFNGLSATISSWSNTSVGVKVPNGAGSGNIVVTAGSLQSNGAAFTVLVPTISSLSPTSGEPGASITITGSNFEASTGTVTFNGKTATTSNWADGSITAVVPNGASSGNVVVSNGGLQSNGVSFTVLVPTISSLSPSGGSPGTTVTIAGRYFGGTAGTVTFNGQSATTTTWSDSSIATVVPSSATTGNVVVTNGGLQSNGVAFTVIPVINALTPSSGPAGASVTIAGGGFGNATGTVTFAGQAAAISSWSASSVVATVPGGAGSGSVIVTPAAGTASNGVNFTVIANAFPGPIAYSYDELGRLVGAVASSGDAAGYSYDAVGNILAINHYTSSQVAVFALEPNSGPVGAQVTIQGANFAATASQNAVTFNGTAATITSASSTQLVVSVPAGATSGQITVTAPAGSATSSESFTVQASSGLPTITSFTPALISAGQPVTVTGANFDTTPPNDRLILNVSPATMPSAPPPTSTTLTLTVPSATASGHISLSTPGGAAVSSSDLYVYPPNFNPAQSPATLLERISLNSPATVSIPNGSSGAIGLLLFDGIEGQLISVYTSGNSGGYFFAVQNPDYTRLEGTGCQTVCFFDSQRLPRTGTYTVLVQDGATFTLWVTIPFAAPISTNGTGLNLNLLPGQNARLSFNGVTGQSATVQISNNVINNTVTLSLLNPDGSTLNSITQGNSFFGFTNTLPQTGSYTVVVDPGSSASGAMTVSVQIP